MVIFYSDDLEENQSVETPIGLSDVSKLFKNIEEIKKQHSGNYKKIDESQKNTELFPSITDMREKAICVYNDFIYAVPFKKAIPLSKDVYIQIFTNFNSQRYQNIGPYYTTQEAKELFQTQDNYLFLKKDDSNNMIPIGTGSIDPIIVTDTCTLSYNILPEEIKLGYGTQICAMLMGIVKKKDKYEKIQLIIESANGASIRIAEKNGFDLWTPEPIIARKMLTKCYVYKKLVSEILDNPKIIFTKTKTEQDVEENANTTSAIEQNDNYDSQEEQIKT